MEIRVDAPKPVLYAGISLIVVFIVTLIFCWWLTIQLSRSRAYDNGRFDEARQNPARIYIEDGRPFGWYNGTYFKLRKIGAKTFVAE